MRIDFEPGGLGAEFMQAIVDLPDSLYRRSEALAASRGASVEQFIVEAVAKEVQGIFPAPLASENVKDSIGGAPAVNIEGSARYRPERYR
jgi:hypothetical protein